MVAYLDSHTVSAEYVYWQIEEEKVRAFLIATNHGMDSWLRDQWEVAERHADDVFDPEHHDAGLVAEIYHRQIGVWPADYFWQLSSAVVKDAMALYEMLLESLANQVLRRAGRRLLTLDTENSWQWPECRAFYSHYVGIEVTPDKVEGVRWIRNKLAHLRGELRTDAGRIELASHAVELGLDKAPSSAETELGLVHHTSYMTSGVVLTQLQTWRLLDIIAEHAGKVALAAFPYIYGRATNAYLDALRTGRPIAVDGLSVKQAGKLFGA